ncbi:MAG: D-alanine--D-alanine ligase, partial [Candidatus Eremiobacteraeota bacterium]|nr:D-alanine--D-alanine ligase [Candidatus Eremiobacteraeota bacterium]
MAELRKARVAVVMGGKSAEREISIASGTPVARTLATLGYDVQSIDYDERFIDAIR